MSAGMHFCYRGRAVDEPDEGESNNESRDFERMIVGPLKPIFQVIYCSAAASS